MGFVEDVERSASGAFRQLFGELYPLRLASRKRGRLLTDLDISEADTPQRGELVAHRRYSGEEFASFLNGHRENVGDRFALERNFQRFTVVALAIADITGDINVRQEVHFDLDDTIALACLAAPAFDIE